MNSAPDDIHLTLDPVAVSAWHAIRTVAKPLEKYGQKAFVELLGQGQPARRAAVQCGISGASFGAKLANALTTEGQGLALNDDLGLAKDGFDAGNPCFTAIQQAQKELTGQPKPEWNRTLPLTTTEAFSIAAAERPALDGALATAARALKQGSVVALKLAHRG